MQLALAIGLAALYVVLAVALGALSPWQHDLGILYWFLVPTVGLTCAGFALAQLVQRLAPVPWNAARGPGLPPRCVHLSWRAAARGPALVPVLFFPGYLATSFWKVGERGPRSIAAVIVALALIAVALIARKLKREMRLLRDGSVAMARIDHRTNTGEDPWEGIRYSFTTSDGLAVLGSAYDRGYGLFEGSTVPVFYDPQRPKDHLAACACWLETDRCV